MTPLAPVAPPTSGSIAMASVLALHASSAPTRTAIVCGDDAVDFATLDARSTAAAHVLVERGVRPGDTVLIGLPNSVELFVATFATWKAGAVPLPLSSALPGPELAALVDLADPAVVVGLGGTGRPTVAAADLAASAAATALPATSGDQPWKIIASGGSTGRPKLIVAGRPARTDPAEEQYTIRPGDVVLAPGPLYHQGPFIFTMTGLFQGNTIVTSPRFDAETTLRLIERHRVTWATSSRR